MTIDEAEDRQHPQRRRRRGLAIGAGLGSLGIAALWLERTPIATQVIDRELARRGVQAHYSIVRLGFGGATLAGLSIGDPAAPDLTASRVTAIGSASCRERVCQYVSISVVDVSLKKK